ncbi:hypothetical protein [Pedobacter sp. Hv1]|uniref:hypothetical protein n=1 Tax=Pedobacter sp. Hv1 TaxID=1740090 RepID=UPI0006D8CEB7|nr:hypothetical protein [Pedobacter sp. Hv1]KQB98835.1 hypothetical protein AQF98_21070 [Pedobacter sp. Hv1]
MSTNIAEHIASKMGYPQLMELLGEELSGTALNSLLLAVFNQRMATQAPTSLLKQYAQNRLVKPAAVNVLRLKTQELATLQFFCSQRFEPIELSPVAQLGTCSVFGITNQQKVLTALRNSEVQADATNSLALHYAFLKKNNVKMFGTHRFATVNRLLRTPLTEIEGHTPHFSIGCLVTAGVDTGSFEFEKLALYEHLSTHAQLLKNIYQCKEVSFSIIPLNLDGNGERMLEFCLAHLKAQMPGFEISVKANNPTQNYYQGLQVKTHIQINGAQIDIGDGGFVDWSQQLLGNKKERMFTSAIGIQYLHVLLGDLWKQEG